MSTDHGALVACPFCGYHAAEYGMLLHIEELHAEGDSPFVAKEEANPENADEEDDYAQCPVEGCGEVLLTTEVEYHVELHEEQQALDASIGSETPPSSQSVTNTPGPSDAASRHVEADGDNGKQRDRSLGSGRHSKSVQAWRQILNMPHHLRVISGTVKMDRPTRGLVGARENKRLGKAELGKYANETAMPEWLVQHLEKGWESSLEVDSMFLRGVIGVLEQLLNQSPATKYAYLCHPEVHHVSKLKREGGFCGYRNIQMMTSYINGVQFYGSEHFSGKLPSIFRIQDLIEEAWDQGINVQGRVETGGIRGTRKYIGTPEAQAVFCSLGIPCEAQGFKDREPGRSEARLLKEIERYFQSGNFDMGAKARCTTLPPIYWQHPGHSMTIVGIERLKSGQTNLLVFDPMFHDPHAITRLIDRQIKDENPESLLKPYRRGNKYLKKYKEFEILRLKPRPADLFQ